MPQAFGYPRLSHGRSVALQSGGEVRAAACGARTPGPSVGGPGSVSRSSAGGREPFGGVMF
eukprot:3719467-Prymnesium_polylepis.1